MFSCSTQACLSSIVLSDWLKDSKIFGKSFWFRAALSLKCMKLSSSSRWIPRSCTHSLIKACIRIIFFQTDTVLSNQKYFNFDNPLLKDIQWGTGYLENNPQSWDYGWKWALKLLIVFHSHVTLIFDFGDSQILYLQVNMCSNVLLCQALSC